MVIPKLRMCRGRSLSPAPGVVRWDDERVPGRGPWRRGTSEVRPVPPAPRGGILIIMAGVSDNLASDIYDEALKYNMSIIVEVHTVEEAKRALRFNEALIGINNRNLKTLKTDINTTYDIHDVLINHKGPLVSESGIKTKDELLELSKKTSIKTFLIGESLLKNLENNSIFSVL